MSGCTIHEGPTSAVTSQSIGINLLLVSRQIYHEAVLKPFTEASFYCLSLDRGRICGLRPFVDALVPAQAKTITRLRMVVQCSYRGPAREMLLCAHYAPIFCKGTIKKLEGLRELQIVLAPLLTAEPKAHYFLTDLWGDFRYARTQRKLAEKGVKSLRIAMEAEFVDADRLGEMESSYLTFAGRNETAEIEKWLEKTGVELLFGRSVADGLQPLPRDERVVQADNTRGTSPETTLEAMRQAREESQERYLASVRAPYLA